MLLITSYFPHQDVEKLRSFLNEVRLPYMVLSTVPLDGMNHLVFTPSKFPPPDDTLKAALTFLQHNLTNDLFDECHVVDWETICLNSSYVSEVGKLKATQLNVSVVEENLTVEDFRLLPYMENLVKICGDLKLQGTDRLFKDNPKVLIPKIISGKKKELINLFSIFVNERSKIDSSKFTGTIPILNTQLHTV